MGCIEYWRGYVKFKRQRGREAEMQRGKEAGREAGAERQAERPGQCARSNSAAAMGALKTQKHGLTRKRRYTRERCEHMSARTHTGALALACVRSSTVCTIMDECDWWWMCAKVWLQQSECWMSATLWFQQSECFCMSAVAMCHVPTLWTRMESRERQIVDVLVENLRGLWEVDILCKCKRIQVQNRHNTHLGN